MKVEVTNVTPLMARKWLERVAPFNRPVHASVVRKYRDALIRGEYVMSHQGLAFDTDGWLMDGQHRLHAIAELPDDTVFPMVVTTGLSRDAFLVMDQGMKRGTADALRRAKRAVEVAKLLAYFAYSKSYSLTAMVVEPFVDRTESIHDVIVSNAPKSVKTWSSAPVRSAAVLSVLMGVDVSYISRLYRGLVMSEYADLPPVALSLVKAVNNGNARCGNVSDFFARCMVMFDPRNANQVRIQINDPKKALAMVRVQFADIMHTEPAKPDGEAQAELPAEKPAFWRANPRTT